MSESDPFAPGSSFMTTMLPALGWQIPDAGGYQTYTGKQKYHHAYKAALAKVIAEENPLPTESILPEAIAMKFLSNIIVDARGSMGGITADRGRSGLHFKSRGKAADRRTEEQLEVRKRYAMLESIWNQISREQRQHWLDYFKQLKPGCRNLRIRRGQAFAEPREMFKSVNMRLLCNNYPYVLTPPTPLYFTAMPILGVEIFPLETRVYVPKGQDWQGEASTLNIKNSRPVSAGRYYPWAGMKKCGDYVTDPYNEYPDWVTVNQSDYPNTATGSKVWIDTYVVKPDGSSSHVWNGGPFIVQA